MPLAAEGKKTKQTSGKDKTLPPKSLFAIRGISPQKTKTPDMGGVHNIEPKGGKDKNSSPHTNALSDDAKIGRASSDKGFI